MDSTFEALAARRGGYILRPDLLDLGYRDRHISDAIKTGVLVWLRAGTYAPQTINLLPPEQRHRLLAFAVIDKLPSDAVLSHHSAAVAHTGQSYGIDLRTVHVTHPDGRSHRSGAGVVHHVGRLRAEDIVEVEGRRLVVPARAAIESAAISGVEAGLIQTSAVLRSCHVTPEELLERLGQMARRPGVASARLSVLWAAPECETAGEVRSVYMFRMGGLPVPRMQVEFFDLDGRLIGRVDFDWPEYCHCGEFDGIIKYGRLNPFSDSMVGQVLVEEKRREDKIRAAPRGMSRWIYRELATPQTTCRRIAAAMEQSRRLHGRPPSTVIA